MLQRAARVVRISRWVPKLLDQLGLFDSIRVTVVDFYQYPAGVLCFYC
jgi:hypothetical protein